MRRTALRILLCSVTVIAFIFVFLFSALAIVFRGPSEAARDLAVSTVMETSALKVLARTFFSDDKIGEIIRANTARIPISETDTSQIKLPSTGDGFDKNAITIEDVKGDTFVGKMMIVNDPSRIYVYSCPNFSINTTGLRLMEMIEETGAVAGINGGGFYDANGMGSGGMPLGIVIQNGEVLQGTSSSSDIVIGFDGDHKLHVGAMNTAEARDRNLKEALSFGPALVINGERVPSRGWGGGLNPRTAIGQRADGSVLMLVIDGRQPSSLGATYSDLADIMVEYGAVNAGNLDGGSSSVLVHEGKIINKISRIIGERPLPTAFLVR
ncbi:MAG: phosphodiester glycosidase family protein [Oscillospiraceae bacterium]